MEVYRKVRLACSEGMSRRAAAREFGISRQSVDKMLSYSEPPGYRRRAEVKRPKLDGFTEIIDRWLEEDKGVPRKQQHTAKRILDRLRAEHRFGGGYTTVKDYVRLHRQRSKEAYVPLAHDPGHAQADFGEAQVKIAGVVQKAHFFVLDLPHSDSLYVRAYKAATAEAWMDGHVHAFSFFGRAPLSVLYDNDRCLVSQIHPEGTRKRAHLFSSMLSHYVYRDRYGRPGKGNDKGKVEGGVGFARRNFMVPIPEFNTWEAFNAHLEHCCRERQSAILRGHSETIGQRLQADLAAMKPLPAAPFDACDKSHGQVNSQSMVRYKNNDYSVPVAYAHRQVWLRGYVDDLAIGCQGEEIARHKRSYGKEELVFNPLHYLPLIERKINSFDQAAPLKDWELPEEFHTLQRLMEAQMLKMGRREYVQVLRLIETFGLEDLHAAVKQALKLRAASFDAIKHLLLCKREARPANLDLSTYPYLPPATVQSTSTSSYMELLSSHSWCSGGVNDKGLAEGERAR